MLSATSRTVKFTLFNKSPYHLNIIPLHVPVYLYCSGNRLSRCLRVFRKLEIISGSENIFGRWRQKTIQRNDMTSGSSLEYWYLSIRLFPVRTWMQRHPVPSVISYAYQAVEVQRYHTALVHFLFLRHKISVRADLFFNGELSGLFPPNLRPSKITKVYYGCWKNKIPSSHDSYIYGAEDLNSGGGMHFKAQCY
jgi:hypothetical protein